MSRIHLHPDPGTLINGLLILRSTPTAKRSNPTLTLQCKCGAEFETSHNWARALEVKKREQRCYSCRRTKTTEKQKKNAANGTQRASSMKKANLTPEEKKRVEFLVWRHIRAMQKTGAPRDDCPAKDYQDKVEREALELVLLERETGEDQLPSWTRENIGEGLQRQDYNQYGSPTVEVG